MSDLPKFVDAHIFDGPGVIYTLKGKVDCVNTFGEFKRNIFLHWFLNQLEHCSRLDFIWDRYPAHSLKSYTRQETSCSRKRYATVRNEQFS